MRATTLTLVTYDFERATRFARNALLFAAAPFIGLAYVIAAPFVGLGALAWMAVHAAMTEAAK
jgi:hypothetical protein